MKTETKKKLKWWGEVALVAVIVVVAAYFGVDQTCSKCGRNCNCS